MPLIPALRSQRQAGRSVNLRPAGSTKASSRTNTKTIQRNPVLKEKEKRKNLDAQLVRMYI